MVYAFLKILMRITVRIFFRSITVRNKSLISLKGPLVVVADRPGTFLGSYFDRHLTESESIFSGQRRIIQREIYFLDLIGVEHDSGIP